MNKVLVTVTILCLFVATGSIFGQSANGTVGGSVEDSSKALIPGVTITLTNTGTGVVATTISNESGAYAFSSVPPGTYRVGAALPGFKTSSFSNVLVGTSAQVRLNFTMEIGEISSQVEVAVSSQQLLTESSASIGDVLSLERLRELPSVNGDVLDLVRIEPGLRFPPQGAQFASLTGLPVETVNTVRDGLSVTDGRNTNGIFSVTTINPDLVGEIRVILSPVDAEVGRGNGQVQISTRSGTNRYTGSVVWNIRNTALSANTWANNRTTDLNGAWSPTPLDWRNGNQYTISYGGPIVRNKTFFFALWDQNISRTRDLVSNTVLTDTARKGIFRYFTGWNSGNALTPPPLTFPANATNGTYPAVDPSGAPVAPARNPDGTPYTGGLRCFSVFGNVKVDGSPFTAADCPGGTAVIDVPWDPLRPAFDKTGYIAKILDLMPRANFFAPGGTTIDGLNLAQNRYVRGRGGDNGAATRNGTDPSATERKQINLKIDHNFSNKNRLSTGWSYERDDNADNIANWQGGFNGASFRRPQVLTVNLTSTLSPTLVNEGRFGISGYGRNEVLPPWYSTDASIRQGAEALLLKGGTNPANGVVYPVAFTPGAGNFAFGNNVINTGSTYSGNNSPLYNFADTMSLTRGQHSFKAGAEVRLTRSSGFSGSVIPTASGGAGGNVSPLNGNTPPAALTGLLTNSRANAANMLYLMSGSVNTASSLYWISSPEDVQGGTWQDYSTDQQRSRTVIQNEAAFFFKDDWKVTRNLTFNLGIRWEYYGVPYLKGGFTATVAGQGLGLFGQNISPDGPFDRWLLAPGHVYLSGYGTVPAATALQCVAGVQQSALLPVSTCDPKKLTQIEFVGPDSPNPDKTAFPNDYNNFGPALGFSWQVPWFGQGKTTVRGGYQMTFGGAQRNVNTIETRIGNLPGNSSTANTITTDFPQLTTNRALQLSDLSLLVPVKPTSPATPGGLVPIYNRATTFSAYDPAYATPYVTNLTLSVTRSLTRNLTLDVRYTGALGRKRQGSINLNTTNVYFNQELLDALEMTRRGLDAPLFDQMFAGLNLSGQTTGGYGAVGTCVALAGAPAAEGCAAGTVLNHGSAHLRRSTNFGANIANGNFDAVAGTLNTLSLTSITGRQTPPISGVGGELLRNGCNRLANGLTNISTRCFPEDYIVTNPQLGTPTYVSNLAANNYHSLQVQMILRPIQGFSFQGTYTKAKNLVYVPGGWSNPLDRHADYTESPSSIHNNFTGNGTFELPFGPNKVLFGNSSGWAARLMERWSASLIYIIGNGPRRLIPAGHMTYATGTNTLDVGQQKAVVVSPDFDATMKGKVKWNGDNGQFFPAMAQVTDPQCQLTNRTDTLGFNLFANGNCTLAALAKINPDGTVGEIQLQNPLPGHQGSLGLTQATSGKYELNMSLAKRFQISESKSVQIRLDAQNFLNHADPADARGIATGNSINTTALNFGQIQAKAYSNSSGGARNFIGQIRFSF